jgi:NADH-quinone oxidoreductase subunit K
VIHLIGPVVLAAALAGTGVYGLLARRNAVLVLIGAELVLNAANVLLVTANALPAGGLAAGGAAAGTVADPLLPGQVMAVFVITIAAAEIGLALAVILLLYRRRTTSDLAAVRELGEASATYRVPDDAGAWPTEGGVGGAASDRDGQDGAGGEAAVPGARSALPDGAATGDGARAAGRGSEVRS